MSDIAKVKEIRERTDAGFGDCKSALKEANGDVETAIDIIRKRSAAKASRKIDREASQGKIEISVAPDLKAAAIVEVNVETDFAARHERFQAFCEKVAERVLEVGENAIEELDTERREFIGIIGENIQIRRARRIVSQEGVVGGYVHVNSSYGAIVELTGGTEKLAHDIALHVTALNPLAVNADGLPPEVLERERAIYLDKARDSGKPPQIVERIVEGQLRKFCAESTLFDQPFALNEEVTVEEYLKSHQSSCRRFVRFQLGEGLEQPEELEEKSSS